MIVCKRVIYTGRVQGVGFRASARQLAREFAVAGVVRNLPDGTVELIAQGEADEVTAFLGAVQHTMGRYVDDSETADCPPENRQGFHIGY
jgi:acylphosphatase